MRRYRRKKITPKEADISIEKVDAVSPPKHDYMLEWRTRSSRVRKFKRAALCAVETCVAAALGLLGLLQFVPWYQWLFF